MSKPILSRFYSTIFVKFNDVLSFYDNAASDVDT